MADMLYLSKDEQFKIDMVILGFKEYRPVLLHSLSLRQSAVADTRPRKSQRAFEDWIIREQKTCIVRQLYLVESLVP